MCCGAAAISKALERRQRPRKDEFFGGRRVGHIEFNSQRVQVPYY